MGMTNTDNTTPNKKYVLQSVDENGNEVRLYNDGSLRNQNGQLLQLSPMLTHQITSENAREYHKMRKDKILRAIEDKVKDITKTKLPADAIAAIVGKRAEIAMNDSTRIGNDAAKIVLQALDAYQDKVNDDRTTVTRHEYAIDNDTRLLLSELAQMKRGYVDVDSTTVLENDAHSDGESTELE